MEFSRVSLKSDRISLVNVDVEGLRQKLLDVSVILKKTPMSKRKTQSIDDEDGSVGDDLKVTQELILAIYTDIPELQLKTTKTLRKMLSREPDPPIDEVISSGIIPRLVSFLSHPSEMVQFEAAWALTNISAGTSVQTRYVIEAGAVPGFVKLLSSNSVINQEQALWGLGNIAGDSPEFREHVLDCDVIPPLNKLIKSTIKVFTLQIAAWTLSNLCRGKSTFRKVSKSISSFEYLLSQDDCITLADTFWALSYLTDGVGERLQIIIDYDLLPLVIERLVCDDSVVHPALQVIGNICMGDDPQTQAVLDCGILTHLEAHATSCNESIRRQVCWIISNIVAGTASQIQAVVDSDIMPNLLQVISNGSLRSQKEVIWAIKNITSRGSPDNMLYLIKIGVIDKLCCSLTLLDNEILIVSLMSLENLLQLGEQDAKTKGKYNTVALKIEECNGLDKIEHLQSHDSIEIYRRAYNIIETFFGTIEPTVFCDDVLQQRGFY